MAKRYTDTTIWKNQRWFKKLSPNHKLVWKYLTDTCDHAGVWKVDFGQLVEDTGIDDFNIKDFIECCNYDFDKETGERIVRERVKLVNRSNLWITGFVKFQYENKDFMINPKVPAIKSALTLLKGYGTLTEALSKSYITLTEPFGTTKDKDMDKDNSINSMYLPKEKKEEHLCPKMVKIFKEAHASYPDDPENDLDACLKIAYKIAKQKGWMKETVTNGNMKGVLESWKIIIDFTKNDQFFSKLAISGLNTQWQGLIQSMTNKTTKVIEKKELSQSPPLTIMK
jgi:hypothetical protein